MMKKNVNFLIVAGLSKMLESAWAVAHSVMHTKLSLIRISF